MLTGLREDSPARRRWDMCSLVLAIVSMVLVSFQLAFQHRVGLVGSLIVYPEFRDALKSLSSERSEKISALVLSGAVL